jgi:hypothetical protein
MNGKVAPLEEMGIPKPRTNLEGFCLEIKP